ncbi:MAG: DNA-binding transcriptional regulator Fis [Gammaproteobacteria bacterium]|nr:DNA-binding transcriptional regulator Fis [Gammaproteobacteria bacterium]MCP5425773.1 DNA-binding transcriptional regulator Fis [Gammaproteobacteria bacterium]MCP5458616.1 DNA-binding transcriptional regulator Fis [Gammaproteobacteria bacterium]
MVVTKPQISNVDDLPAVPLRVQVQGALRDYFRRLGGLPPANLYKLVLEEVEQPLLETVLQYTRGNQTRAAEILGINRSTLRKKLKQYHLD